MGMGNGCLAGWPGGQSHWVVGLVRYCCGKLLFSGVRDARHPRPPCERGLAKISDFRLGDSFFESLHRYRGPPPFDKGGFAKLQFTNPKEKPASLVGSRCSFKISNPWSEDSGRGWRCPEIWFAASFRRSSRRQSLPPTLPPGSRGHSL